MAKNRRNPLGASAILKSVDFRAFAVNVKTIHPSGNCINPDMQLV